ncbi:type VI secretion system tube protein Hcp [Lentisphaerota bacterium ZTH]|nr:type VI secretion system tube protein Hcp [Lentisphaerota bacterium]WET05223.1 type VI secretion system tube protein Hcp [Lentisphaerota bacterium ZTH]
MAFAAYITIEGAEGQSTNANHQNWIDVRAYCSGANQETRKGSNLASAGQGIMAPLTFIHSIDKSSPKLAELCMNGKNVPSATLHVCAMIGGKQVIVYEVKLETVRVVEAKQCTIAKDQVVYSEDAALYSAAQAESSNIEPLESISLAADKTTWTYHGFKSDGTGAGQVSAKWEVGQGKGGS